MTSSRAPVRRTPAAPATVGRRHDGAAPAHRHDAAAPSGPALRGASVLGGPALLRSLQRTAGNTAVARTVQRLAAGAATATPVRPIGIKPRDDPRFAAVEARIAGQSARLAVHPAPPAEVRKAQHAAVAPVDDKEAKAKAAQAEEMVGARAPGFDKAAFIAAVRKAIAAQAPKNLDEADSFADSGRAAAVKEQVTGKVAEGRQNSAQDVAERTAQTPNTAVIPDKPVTPLRDAAQPKPRSPGAAAGMPAPAPPEQTDLSAAPRETDATMASAGVTEEQLARSNEPEFTDALSAKKEGERHSATVPDLVRASEARTLGAAAQQATTTGNAGMASLAAVKGRTVARTGAGKNAAKARDEAARARISAYIKGVFDATKRDVETILAGVDAGVSQRFEIGEKAARDAFTADHRARMAQYKDTRYSGLRGKARWTADLFTGLPAEANEIFARSRTLYESRMFALIADIADFIGVELARAKSRIAAGRAEIKRYIDAEPRELRKVAQEAAQGFAEQFDELESEVESKGQALVDDLANRYVEARTAVDDEIKTMQDENKGLWDKAKDAVGGAIRTVLQLKELLLGVLARAAGAIGKILDDPIRFLLHFVAAVKTGIENFAGNILEHLKKGLQGWLLGSLAAAGIELPEKFDLKGIVQLVMSLLGLTWANIRARIVKVIPEPVMNVLEKTVSFIQIILNEGVGGLWRWVLEKVGDLKEMVLAKIQDFVITKIVKAGITWLISLLNPAAAFIKACKMIYDVVTFFLEKAAQIKEFVDSILDSVEAIAAGGVGAVAGYIERTLARTLPMVLGFLASLLGLGGISEEIKKILQAVQRPVMKVVDKLIAGAVKAGKRLLGKIGTRKSDDRTPAQKQQDLDAAVIAGERLIEEKRAPATIRAKLAELKDRHRLSVLELVIDQKNGAMERVHVHGEVNPRRDSKSDYIPAGERRFSLAEGGYPDHEGDPIPLAHGRDDPLRGIARGDPIFDEQGQRAFTDVHTGRKHVNINEEGMRSRIEGPGPGKVRVATRFTSREVMIKAIDACLAEHRDRIDKHFIKEGKPMPVGTPLELEKKMAGRIGTGYERVSGRAILIEEPLFRVTVFLRVSDSEGFRYKVETAYPNR